MKDADRNLELTTELLEAAMRTALTMDVASENTALVKFLKHDAGIAIYRLAFGAGVVWGIKRARGKI